MDDVWPNDLNDMQIRNCSSEEFFQQLGTKKIICFGAGTLLQESQYERYPLNKLEEHIEYMVDNDQKKIGALYNFAGHQFPIYSPDVLKKVNPQTHILMITCMNYVQIYSQLKMMNIPEIDCYFYSAICNHPYVNLQNFLEVEIEKPVYRDWKEKLKQQKLKNCYEGKRCFIIGNGPSVRVQDLERMKDDVTFCVNRIYQLFNQTSWRPTYYFCIDYHAYVADAEIIEQLDIPHKFVPLERAIGSGQVYDDIIYYNRKTMASTVRNHQVVENLELDFSENVEEVVYGATTVLYDVLQFAVYMGFKEIYLYGVDFQHEVERSLDGTISEKAVKDHFSDNYLSGIERFSKVAIPMYLHKICFEKAKILCEKKGICIKNITRKTMLDVFECASVEDILGKDGCKMVPDI